MKKTLIVVNDMSGNSEGVDVDAIRFVCAKNDQIDELRLLSPDQDYDVTGYDKLIVCGGDGTINNAVNKCKDMAIDIFYFPFGTLNERAKATGENLKKSRRLPCMGMVNKNLFSYVIAAGAFTEIGYKAKSGAKKKFKALAYVAKVFAAYKVYDIGAEIVTDEETYVGRYSLIMIIDSDRCFGFKFNKAYRADDKNMHLLMIKNTGKNNLWGKIKMFFPFFRTFFIGFRKEEYHSRHIDFIPVRNVEINLTDKQTFCVDGEAREYEGFMHVEKLNIKPRLFIMQQ